MGVRAWLRHHRMRDPVTGTLRLASCTEPPASSAWSRCEMTGEVTAPGIAPAPVGHCCPAPAGKWPQPGQDLPVRVDRADPRRLVILWDELPPSRDTGEADQQARAIEEQLNATTATPGPAGEPPSPVIPQPPVLAAEDDGPGAPGEVAAPAGTGQPPAGVTPPETVARPTQTMMTGFSHPGLAGGLSPEQAAGLLLNPGGLLRASATVADVHEVESPNDVKAAAGVVDLSLEVSTTSGPGYQAMLRIGFSTPQRRASIATVGTVLPVLVDPVEKDRVVIDMSLFRD